MNNKWMSGRARMGAVLAAVVLAGCASSGGQLKGPTGAFAELKPTQANEAVVVFFREEGTEGRVPLVLTNDRVVGSLLAGRYAQTRVCAGGLMAGTADRADVVGVPKYQPVAVKAGEALYLQVSETAAGQFQLKPLDAALARERLGKLQTASHIINRHVPDCTPKVAAVAPVFAPAPAAVAPVAAPSVPVVLKRVELGADALFHFDRFGANDMLPQGRAALTQLVDDIQRSGVVIERIRLTGHTDRLGTPAYNMKLSQQRAESVGAFLRRAGLVMPIETMGRGEEEPVTTGCVGQKASPALVSCLQADRRVTVDLIGSVQQTIVMPTR
ncbi:MAG: OmpA family protein [Hydrogenophaga sp.]|nr:OmpA family protein [Hydrogenophaga sp.]